MKPCLSETLTMPRSFAEDAAAFAEAGAAGMEVWLTKLESHLKEHTAAETRELLARLGITLVAGAYQGGLLLSHGEQRREHVDHFQRRLNLCQELGVSTLILVPDHAEKVDLLDLPEARSSLLQAAQLAASFDVRLALEFQGSSRWCACVETAAALVEACQMPNLGLCFDVFHYFTGPSKLDDLALLNRANLFHVQLCDLAGVPREFARDADRILPGDGDLSLKPILDHFSTIGYDGWVSVELFNPQLWQLHAAQVASTALASLRRLLK